MIKLFLGFLAAWVAINAYSEDLPQNDLKFNASLEKKVYKVGQPFIVNLEFLNMTNKNIGLSINTDSIALNVYDMSGERISTQSCFDGMAMALMAPGERFSSDVDLKDQLPVLEGQYSIQFAYAHKSDVSGQGFQFTDGSQWKGVVESNKLSVAVEE
jgi:hypothetical protein